MSYKLPSFRDTFESAVGKLPQTIEPSIEHIPDGKLPAGAKLIFPEKAIANIGDGSIFNKLGKYGFALIQNVQENWQIKTLAEHVDDVTKEIIQATGLAERQDPLGREGDFWARIWSQGPAWHRDYITPHNVRGIGILGSEQPVNSKGGNFQIISTAGNDIVYECPFNSGQNIVVFHDTEHRGTLRSKIDPDKPASHGYQRRSLTYSSCL